MSAIWIILIIIGGALLLYLAFAYNRLITLRNRFRNAFAQIEVQLERRYDLIPNLVETARGYMKHEQETLDAVIRARNAAASAEARAAAEPGERGAIAELAGAERELGGALTRFFALAEAYPDLKANQNMMQLSEELTSTENRVAFARQSYNDAVTAYNIARERVPTNLVASLFDFGPAELLVIEDEAARRAPRVDFGG